jgi:plasmid stability protein
MKTTIELPDELSRQVKAAAALRGQSMKEFLTEVLTRELSPVVPQQADQNARQKRAASLIEELESLAGRIGEKWGGAADAVQAVREQRRD